MHWQLVELGEFAWLAEPVGWRHADQAQSLVLKAAAVLARNRIWSTVHPGAHSLLLECDCTSPDSRATWVAALTSDLAAIAAAAEDEPESSKIEPDVDLISESIQLGVHFDGPDLPWVAQALARSESALKAELCQLEYRVAMLGFLPGFAYLRGLPTHLSVPRRNQPRARVPAGSLALGGAYLGVYPCPAPGGWHLLGRVDIAMFDPQRMPPACLQAGMRVSLLDLAADA